MKRKIFVISLILLGLVSCNKQKLKKPTDVSFQMDINKAPTIDGQLTFIGGHFIMHTLEFSGTREKGDPVSFSKVYSGGLTIPFDLSSNLTDLQFDIPQGAYNKVDLAFDTYEEGTVPCILVEGTYTYSGGGSIPMRFEFDDSEEFEIEAEEDGGGLIILDTDVLSQAKILLDPNHWFQPVPMSYFESADVTEIEGTNTILIDKDNNEEIFDLILDRIDESTEAVFNY